MSYSVLLSRFAEAVSCEPCPFCGVCHRVSFDVRETAKGLSPLVFLEFSDDACEGFKDLVKKRLRTL